MQKIVSVSDPQISLDNRFIVCVVPRANMDQDRHDTAPVLIDTATGAQLALTFARKGISSPRWSPSGERLALLAKAPTGKAEKRQIFVLSMNGDDPREITDAPPIRTPTLIRSDAGDFRATVTQPYELNHALKDNGVTTRFLAYLVRGHFPEDPVRTMAAGSAGLMNMSDERQQKIGGETWSGTYVGRPSRRSLD